MISDKYFRIDKEILHNEDISHFDIYYPIDLSSNLECLISKGHEITPNHIRLMEEKQSLFIKVSEKELYKKFIEDSSSQKKYHIKTTAIYKKATDVIDELYHNPETLGGSQKSKEVVNDLVHTILDDEFTIRSMIQIIAHDYYTHTHSLNVSVYALSLGASLGMSKEELNELGESALLHDLGKSKVAIEIINKNGKLTDDEFNKMKKHPELGFHLAVGMGIKNKNVLHGIRYHHEKMDGSGYPSKLKGENIPKFARIVGLCDIFDALTSKRSYKEAMSTYDALSLIKKNMANHVDLNLLNEMIKMFK